MGDSKLGPTPNLALLQYCVLRERTCVPARLARGRREHDRQICLHSSAISHQIVEEFKGSLSQIGKGLRTARQNRIVGIAERHSSDTLWMPTWPVLFGTTLICK